MGISVQELMANEYFRDYEIIAGRKGMHKEIQGITILEAPDGFKWTKGKEMVLSAGYSLMQDPDCVRRAFEDGSIQKTSALMLKVGRYIDRVPDEITALCNEYELPLIIAPFQAPWMEIISQTNVAVMNRTIRNFQVSDPSAGSLITNQSYKETKIRKILHAVENEMKFPAFLYDLTEDKSYYSSPNFKRMTEYYGLKESDYWNPQMESTHHTLCDYINMSRYRLFNRDNPDGPRLSWVIMPIKIHGVTQAYFTIMEAHGLLDYYDEFAVRIAYLQLQSLYEQIAGATDAGYMGFENFIHFALSCNDDEKGKVISQAGAQSISMTKVYDYAVISAGSSVGKKRDALMSAFAMTKCSRIGKLAILDDREMLLLTEVQGDKKRTSEEQSKLISEFMAKVHEILPDEDIRCGVSRENRTLRDIKHCVEKCRKVLKMGPVVMPDAEIIDYEMLGPLAWLDIPEEDLNEMLGKLRNLARDEKNLELLNTLRIYLENNMNYSVTADILYVHINTIRKRIDKVTELLGGELADSSGSPRGGLANDDVTRESEASRNTELDFGNPIVRMKMILLLQLLNADSRS